MCSCYFGLLSLFLYLYKLSFVLTGDADASSITGVPCDYHTLLATSLPLIMYLFLNILSDFAYARTIAFRLFHIRHVHGVVQCICEG